VLLDYYIALVNADAKLDAVGGRQGGVALGHSALHFDSTPDRIHHARKFCEQAVASIFYDPAAVFLDLRIN